MYGQVQSCCLLTKSGGAIYFSFGSIVGAWLCQQEALLLFSLSDVIPIFLCRHFYHDSLFVAEAIDATQQTEEMRRTLSELTTVAVNSLKAGRQASLLMR